MQILKTNEYSSWEAKLRDLRARAHIDARIRRLGLGHFSDSKSVGDGVSEIRIHYGPGYRLYYTRRGLEIVILLVGGDKKTQKRDIELAKLMAKNI